MKGSIKDQTSSRNCRSSSVNGTRIKGRKPEYVVKGGINEVQPFVLLQDEGFFVHFVHGTKQYHSLIEKAYNLQNKERDKERKMKDV